MAEAFPNCRFTGFDTHAGSIEAAQAMRAKRVLSDRVAFILADAKAPLPRPPGRGAAAGARRAGPDGTLMLVEPNASDRVEENLNPVGRIY